MQHRQLFSHHRQRPESSWVHCLWIRDTGGRICKFADIWLCCISWVSVRYQRQNLGRIITKFESCLTEFEEYLSTKLNGISRWLCSYRKVTLNNFPFVYFTIVLHYWERIFDLCQHFSLCQWMGNKCHWNSILLLSFRIFCLWCQLSRRAKHKWKRLIYVTKVYSTSSTACAREKWASCVIQCKCAE